MSNAFLHKRTEPFLAKTSAPFQKVASLKREQLVFDFLTCQVELEIQNEELRAIQQEIKATQSCLESTLNKYASLYNHAPCGYLRLDIKTNIIEANFMAAALLGVAKDRLIGEIITTFATPENQEEIRTHYMQARKLGGRQIIELKVHNHPRGELYVQLETVAEDIEYGLDQFKTVLFDVTERRRAENKMAESENRLRLALLAIPGGVWDLDMVTGKFLVDAGWLSSLGYSRDEFEPTHDFFKKLLHPDDAPQIFEEKQRYLDGKAPVYAIEYRMRAKSGKWQWRQARGIVVRDASGKPIRMVGITVDITKLKAATGLILSANGYLERRVAKRTASLDKTKKTLRELHAHVESIREKEKAFIAREIHDELGSNMTALNLDLDWLKRRLNDPSLLNKVGAMSNQLQSMMKGVQDIASRLRPPILDTMGFLETLKWQVSEFQNHTEIKIRLNVKDNIKISKIFEISLFRLIQESLTNVARHAIATECHIILRKVAFGLLLEIQDNGVGITRKQIDDKKSFGLIGMKERVRAMGGTITIKGARGKGTLLSVYIPENQ